jgi:sulfate transport system permease protein
VTAPSVLDRRPAADGRASTAAAGRARLGVAPGLGLGAAVLWFSLLVLLPLAAVVATSLSGGWAGFFAAVTSPGSVSALRFTVLCVVIVTGINAVMGTIIAWVLVRDAFPGRYVMDIVIDIPFALPTIVAGLVMLTLYGPSSPVGINLLGSSAGVILALLFVTLPFVVRSVQPALQALDRDAEQAAASLGAGPWTAFRRVILPALLPAIASGSALTFARGMGEYGSVLLISGGLDHSRVSSMYVYQQVQNLDYPAAAAVATVLLAISIVMIATLQVLQRWVTNRG